MKWPIDAKCPIALVPLISRCDESFDFPKELPCSIFRQRAAKNRRLGVRNKSVFLLGRKDWMFPVRTKCFFPKRVANHRKHICIWRFNLRTQKQQQIWQRCAKKSCSRSVLCDLCHEMGLMIICTILSRKSRMQNTFPKSWIFNKNDLFCKVCQEEDKGLWGSDFT